MMWFSPWEIARRCCSSRRDLCRCRTGTRWRYRCWSSDNDSCGNGPWHLVVIEPLCWVEWRDRPDDEWYFATPCSFGRCPCRTACLPPGVSSWDPWARCYPQNGSVRRINHPRSILKRGLIHWNNCWFWEPRGYSKGVRWEF